MAKYKVLSTKKLEPSLIEHAKQNGIEIIEQEFIAIRPMNLQERLKDLVALVKADIRHFVFTSQHAVFMFDEIRYADNRSWGFVADVFCLSGKTQEAILDIGGHISAVADDSAALAQIIIAKEIKEVIFFCGNKRRDELPTQLRQAGVKVHELVVYETIETPTVNEQDIDAVLFFSPSAVQSFFSVNRLKKETMCFAIGQTTANSITDFTDNKIIVSESPSQEMMLAAVNFYFQNINCYE